MGKSFSLPECNILLEVAPCKAGATSWVSEMAIAGRKLIRSVCSKWDQAPNCLERYLVGAALVQSSRSANCCVFIFGVAVGCHQLRHPYIFIVSIYGRTNRGN